VFIAVVTVTVVHIWGGGSGCTVSAPVPSLNAQLRALGGFDQAYDSNDTQVLETVAQQAAETTVPSLIGAAAADPVRVASSTPSRPDALVIPLRAPAGAGTPRVAGLVAFLLDCSGRAYYSSVALSTAPADGFPAVGETAAAQRLSVADPDLIYTTNPFHPSWRNPSNGATISAE